jgi:hypothetical protein
VACTTGFGVGGITAVSAATGCNSIAPGYSLAAAGTTPLACAAGNYCLGFSAATGAVFAAAGNAVTTGPAAAFGLTACPAGTTWAGSASSSATSAAVCDDLAAGYYIRTAIAAQANAGAVTALTTGIQQCPAGYYCAGSLGGIDTANTNGITAGTTGSTFIWDAIPAIAATACTTGTSSVVGATAVSACTLVAPGYYIDHSALNTPATCPAGEYCPGGGAVGTAGGDNNCPLGSVGPATSSITNSNINDCILSTGYYIAASNVNLPVPCPAASICAGGGPLGTAVAAVACPTGSTNAACITPAGPATVSTGPTTVTTAPVSVSPTSQPITVNFTHSPVFSAAPLAAAANSAVLVLAALLALVAF